MKFRVLLAEDHAMFRKALRMVLELSPEIEIVAEAADGPAVLEGVERCQPDVVCMDIRMPGLDGIEATRQIIARRPGTRIVGLSAHSDPVTVNAMLDAGALGYVMKTEAGQHLLAAIREVALDKRYVSPGAGL